MICSHCQELISDYIDGALELGEQTQVERHLADCASCRIVRDDLLQIAHFSRRLPVQTPPGTVWTRIEEELSANPRTLWAGVQNWWNRLPRRYVDLSLPQLAAAAAAVAIVIWAGFLFTRSETGAEMEGAIGDPQIVALQTNLLSNPDIQKIEQRIDELRETVEERKVAWNPDLRVTFERNMLHIEQSLAECRQELAHNPSDPASRDLMLNAYREKVRLLEGFLRIDR